MLFYYFFLSFFKKCKTEKHNKIYKKNLVPGRAPPQVLHLRHLCVVQKVVQNQDKPLPPAALNDQLGSLTALGVFHSKQFCNLTTMVLSKLVT